MFLRQYAQSPPNARTRTPGNCSNPWLLETGNDGCWAFRQRSNGDHYWTALTPLPIPWATLEPAADGYFFFSSLKSSSVQSTTYPSVRATYRLPPCPVCSHAKACTSPVALAAT